MTCAFCEGPIPAHRPDATYCGKTCKRKAQERRARNRRWAQSVAPPPPPSRCGTCRKLACPTREAAKAAKRAIEVQTGHVDEVRYYECPEGWWHWTRLDATLDGYRARVVSRA